MYLVSICMDSDGDFGFEDYMNLNGKKFLTDNLQEAKEIMFKHFEKVLETYHTTKDYIHCDRRIRQVYDDLVECNWLYNDEWRSFEYDMGNQHFEYLIEEVDYLRNRKKE